MQAADYTDALCVEGGGSTAALQPQTLLALQACETRVALQTFVPLLQRIEALCLEERPGVLAPASLVLQTEENADYSCSRLD